MKVQVLLSTYNGEKYLRQQIDSILNQKGVKLSILVRDDGSTDNTKTILEEYASKGKLVWYTGENVKPAKSFFNLMTNAKDADYYAFADQDDIWEENKLSSAIKILSKKDKSIPSLYFSKAQLVDEKLNIIPNGNYPKGVLKFSEALIRNNATGCTIVINTQLLNKINMYTPDKLIMHDHWIYLLCLAIGGDVTYDPNSYIKYRQHEGNVCGGKSNFFKKYKRSGINDKENIRYNMALQLLQNYKNEINDENLQHINKIIDYKSSLKNKFSLIKDKNFRSDSTLSNISMIISILKNKL